ncbi:hypothetical protein FACS1894208_00210 [Clostridia bacterium]|nr:hypothetical protein FACS1894208_00210 [Clostridia bacterium]
MAQSWYKKYRPRTFAEYAGSFADVAVKRFSDTEQRPQVTLLHGVYGCGKTTAARLLAGYYLCESLDEEGQPCGKCSGCRQLADLIADGEDDSASESVQEINASGVNRVEDIRRLINDSMLTLPTMSKYKVFIFDECHRITPEAQNALLKILEDIPAHLAVIFATTEPDKLLPAVVSRCQLTVEVRRQTLDSMTEILINIARKEGLSVEKKALQIIAKKGGRIPRDCINLLEDISAAYDQRVTAQNVLERTGETDTALYFEFFKAAHSGLTGILTFLSNFSQGDVTYQKFLSGLSRFVLDGVYIRMGIGEDSYDKSYLKTVKKLLADYKADEFHKLLRLIDEAARRTPASIGSTDLALSVLALNIRDIEMEGKAADVVTDATDEVSSTQASTPPVKRLKAQTSMTTPAKELKVQAMDETAAGAQKFVDKDFRASTPPMNVVADPSDVDALFAGLGAVAYVPD